MEETRATSIATEGIRLAWGLEEHLQKLNQSLTMIKAMLQDAARRPVTVDSVKLWLEKLKHVAYDAEGLFDEFAYEIFCKDPQKKKVCDFVSLHNPVAFRLNMGKKATNISGTVDEIQKLPTGFGFGFGIRSLKHVDRAPEISWDRETDFFLDSSEVLIGREDDVSKVMKLLIGSIDQQVFFVLPIVGMAGVGKNIIADKVFEEVKERELFDISIWFCVSNDFNKFRILREMFQKINETTGGLNNFDTILENLKKKLENETDDVWNEEPDKWDGLKDLLLKIYGNNGNVVVTSCSKEVTSMMETSLGKPRRLSDDQCWSIIKQKVSRGGGASVASGLESVRKEIAKRCAGSPLLANVLGETLRKKETQECQSILSGRVWDSLD